MKSQKNPSPVDSGPEYLTIPEFFPGVTPRSTPASSPAESEQGCIQPFTDSEMLMIAKIRTERRLRNGAPRYERAWDAVKQLLLALKKK